MTVRASVLRSNLPFLLTGLLVLVLIFLPHGDFSAEQALFSRGFMLCFFLVGGGALQSIAPLWSLTPTFFIVVFGHGLSRVVGVVSEPPVWMVTGGVLVFVWTPLIVRLLERRVMPLTSEYGSVKDIPIGRLVRFFALPWCAAAMHATLYGLFLPAYDGIASSDIALRAFGGCAAGALLAAVSGKWKLYAVLFGVPAITVTMLTGVNAVTTLTFGWLAGYVVACVMRDESTLYRPLLFREHRSAQATSPSHPSRVRSLGMTTISTLVLGYLRFRIDKMDAQGMFARWRKKRWRVVISTNAHRLGFLYEEMKTLCEGPIILEADHDSSPQGDYFLASPELIASHSAVGEALEGLFFDEGVLVLLKGVTVMAQISPTEREQLCTWLKTSTPSD